MKILPPTNSLPPSRYQGRNNHNPDYDKIIEQAKQIEVGTHLPIEYESKKEVDNVRKALLARILDLDNDMEYGDMTISVRGKTVYVTRNR